MSLNFNQALESTLEISLEKGGKVYLEMSVCAYLFLKYRKNTLLYVDLE